MTATYWMYLSETFWLCLVVMVRMYICRAASRSAALDFSSGPKRSKTTSLQLCGSKQSIFEDQWRKSISPLRGACNAALWLALNIWGWRFYQTGPIFFLKPSCRNWKHSWLNSDDWCITWKAGICLPSNHCVHLIIRENWIKSGWLRMRGWCIRQTHCDCQLLTSNQLFMNLFQRVVYS